MEQLLHCPAVNHRRKILTLAGRIRKATIFIAATLTAIHCQKWTALNSIIVLVCSIDIVLHRSTRLHNCYFVKDHGLYVILALTVCHGRNVDAFSLNILQCTFDGCHVDSVKHSSVFLVECFIVRRYETLMLGIPYRCITLNSHCHARHL
ncbi:hypothetical protein PsorP6_015336 [Peronosclerospora sorghi]|uniref:Uncharacterized protein n=1 Tax=Peronosclerospora sorghi TaxID=230839 RepID=A0ACC0VSW6_9STRA|nr:hypothetical protein PsorP6_015336 [Peronosclerospora sorghi]